MGVATMQTITLGIPLPQLAWDFGWLVILGLGAFTADNEPVAANRKSDSLSPGAGVRA